MFPVGGCTFVWRGKRAIINSFYVQVSILSVLLGGWLVAEIVTATHQVGHVFRVAVRDAIFFYSTARVSSTCVQDILWSQTGKTDLFASVQRWSADHEPYVHVIGGCWR